MSSGKPRTFGGSDCVRRLGRGGEEEGGYTINGTVTKWISEKATCFVRDGIASIGRNEQENWLNIIYTSHVRHI